MAQDIQVRLVGNRQSSDDGIAQRALTLLACSWLVPQHDIRVRVSDGWLTLSGLVDWNFQGQAAKSQVRELSEVIGVSNDIEIESVVQNGDVRRCMLDALMRQAKIEPGNITIDMRARGVVHLDGEIDRWDERRAVT